MKPTLHDLVEEIREVTTRADSAEARSALTYCLKQLKISAASLIQSEEGEGEEGVAD